MRERASREFARGRDRDIREPGRSFDRERFDRGEDRYAGGAGGLGGYGAGRYGAGGDGGAGAGGYGGSGGYIGRTDPIRDSGGWNDRETRWSGPMTASAEYGVAWWAPGPYTGRGPRGFTRSDERLRDDVCGRLEQSGVIDAADIEVTVREGVVTLQGTVPDRAQKRFAEDAAESCPGVREVENELHVRRAGPGQGTAEAASQPTAAGDQGFAPPGPAGGATGTVGRRRGGRDQGTPRGGTRPEGGQKVTSGQNGGAQQQG